MSPTVNVLKCITSDWFKWPIRILFTLLILAAVGLFFAPSNGDKKVIMALNTSFTALGGFAVCFGIVIQLIVVIAFRKGVMFNESLLYVTMGLLTLLLSILHLSIIQERKVLDLLIVVSFIMLCHMVLWIVSLYMKSYGQRFSNTNNDEFWYDRLLFGANIKDFGDKFAHEFYERADIQCVIRNYLMNSTTRRARADCKIPEHVPNKPIEMSYAAQIQTAAELSKESGGQCNPNQITEERTVQKRVESLEDKDGYGRHPPIDKNRADGDRYGIYPSFDDDESDDYGGKSCVEAMGYN